jgi:hypothetical protein
MRGFYIGMLGLFGMLLIGSSTHWAWAAERDAIQPVYEHPPFWDGQFTDASSGYHYAWPDAGSSEGKSGNRPKDNPQHYWIPKPRQWEDTDPEEISDRRSKGPFSHVYTPYALVRFERDLLYREWKFTKGYYQIKLGNYNDGSPKTKLYPEDESASMAGLQTPPPTQGATLGNRLLKGVKTAGKLLDGKAPVPDPPDVFESEKQRLASTETLVIKQLGKVVAVLPVLKQTPYGGKRKFPRKLKQPLGSFDYDPNQAWLHVWDGLTIYSTSLDYKG